MPYRTRLPVLVRIFNQSSLFQTVVPNPGPKHEMPGRVFLCFHGPARSITSFYRQERAGTDRSVIVAVTKSLPVSGLSSSCTMMQVSFFTADSVKHVWRVPGCICRRWRPQGDSNHRAIPSRGQCPRPLDNGAIVAAGKTRTAVLWRRQLVSNRRPLRRRSTLSRLTYGPAPRDGSLGDRWLPVTQVYWPKPALRHRRTCGGRHVEKDPNLLLISHLGHRT